MCKACLNDWRAGLVSGGSLEEMTAAQQRAELGRQSRRLKGGE